MVDRLDELLARARAAQTRSLELRERLTGQPFVGENLGSAGMTRRETRALPRESRTLSAARTVLLHQQLTILGRELTRPISASPDPSEDS